MPTKVVVTLKARPDGNGGIDWDDRDCRFVPPGSGRKNGQVLQITADGPADITFDLDDRTGRNLRFPETPREAIWLQNGSACPTQPGDADGEFLIRQLGRKKLTITDTNSQNGEFGYALNFEGDGGTFHFDPIIKNGL
ncbi:MAG: hypothetical protein AVDCRST_MAG09-358 [uncultured Sphingomonas sp.]|uniref:Uncharacterized protein n=1 Tax=uncultured Sphingomonas sp. TaxID=158754 RepID=A0A6J4SD19_9SPHN|nr:hypothetical protein [uncultured Sphingomonas sp.]CAA9495127.1 MAG: hypothetical protein AVDCRST_MAG09-358 [uncultured Sphingomonas sp.]